MKHVSHFIEGFQKHHTRRYIGQDQDHWKLEWDAVTTCIYNHHQNLSVIIRAKNGVRDGASGDSCDPTNVSTTIDLSRFWTVCLQY